MPVFKTRGISIVGISCAVPRNVESVSSFSEQFGEETTKKFSKNTGVYAVHKTLPDQTAGDLAFLAAKNLFEQKNVERDKIGVLVFVTLSPDYRRPSTACVLQKRLELPRDCAVFDVGLGCSGFVYGMEIVTSMLNSSESEYGLLLCGETASKVAGRQDKSVAMLLGDAGSAVLFHKEKEETITTILKSDGYQYQSIILPAGGFRDMDPTHQYFECKDGIKRSLYELHMDGVSVFSFSISDVLKTIKEYLRITETVPDDYVALHQANMMIISQIAKKLKVDREHLLVSLDRYGNTSGPSIPLALCDAFGNSNEEKRIRVLMAGFGVGLSWGVTSAFIDINSILPIIESDEYYEEGKLRPGTY